MKVTYEKKEWNWSPDYLISDFLEANESYYMMRHWEDSTDLDDDMPESFEKYAYDNGWFDEEIHEAMTEIYIMYLNTQWIM